MHELTGSQAWGNHAVSIICMEQYSEDKPREYKKLEFRMRTAREPDPICIFRNPDTMLYELVDGPDTTPTSRLHKVVEVIEEHGQPIGYTELAELLSTRLERSERMVSRYIKDALERGLIIKGSGSRGKYRIPSDYDDDVLPLDSGKAKDGALF